MCTWFIFHTLFLRNLCKVISQFEKTNLITTRVFLSPTEVLQVFLLYQINVDQWCLFPQKRVGFLKTNNARNKLLEKVQNIECTWNWIMLQNSSYYLSDYVRFKTARNQALSFSPYFLHGPVWSILKIIFWEYQMCVGYSQNRKDKNVLKNARRK